ncbi:unnamed protein product [Gadus morhua 'NCC']
MTFRASDLTRMTCLGVYERCVKISLRKEGKTLRTADWPFLRSRVRDLEREKAEMGAENQRLRTMLVNEIPGLLSTMWQTLGQNNTSSHHHHVPSLGLHDDGEGGAETTALLLPAPPLQPASHTSEDGEFSLATTSTTRSSARPRGPRVGHVLARFPQSRKGVIGNRQSLQALSEIRSASEATRCAARGALSAPVCQGRWSRNTVWIQRLRQLVGDKMREGGEWELVFFRKALCGEHTGPAGDRPELVCYA